MSCTISLSHFKTMHDLLEAQQFTDINFVCNDGEIAAHHSVLAANIGWFEKSHGREVIIVLIEYSKKDVREFLELLYTGKANFVDSEHVKKLLDKFQCNYSETHSAPSSPNLLAPSPSFNGNKKNEQYVVNPFSSKSPKSKSSSSKSSKSKICEDQNSIKSQKPQNQNDSMQQQTKTKNIDDKDQVEVINDLSLMARKRKNHQENQTSNNGNQDVPSCSNVPKRKRQFNLSNWPESPKRSENSSDSEIEVGRLSRKKLVRRKSEPVIVDSTDDEEDSRTAKTTEDKPNNSLSVSNDSSIHKAELEVMKYTSVNEMKQKLSQYCFVCKSFVPDPIKVHTKIHRPMRRQVAVCPHCSLKFPFVKVLPLHIRVCKRK